MVWSARRDSRGARIIIEELGVQPTDGANEKVEGERRQAAFGEVGPIYPPPGPPLRAPAPRPQPERREPPAPAIPTPAPPAAPPPAPVKEAAPDDAPPRPRVFVSERARRADSLDRAPALARLAELIAHKDAEGPLSIALLGGPGAGKSHALEQTFERARALSDLAGSRKSGPFAPRLFALKIEAADLVASPEQTLAARLQSRLAREFPALDAAAHELAAAETSDPQALARAANDALDASRHALERERTAREQAENRRARLTEVVLFETSGAQFDSYARANRARIEPALRAFGFNAPDALADYRGLVQALSETGGPLSRALASARTLWAYRGQKKRIFLGLVFFALAWGLNLMATQRGWLGALEGAGEALRPVATWLAANLAIFALAGKAALVLGLLAFASLAWRAWRFAQPLWRGAALLESDVHARRADIDHAIAHHAQRVDALTREIEVLSQHASEAEKRAGGALSVAPRAAGFASQMQGAPAARAYLAALDRIIAKAEGSEHAPTRILVAVDSLDALPPAAALATFAATASALDRPAFALLTAFDPDHFAEPHARATLARLVQTPFALPPADETHWTTFIGRLAQRAAPVAPAEPANASALDTPLQGPERKLLAALAALAGPAPRNVTRLVNLYRLARHDAPDDLAPVAFMLALALGGDGTERDNVARAMQSGAPDEALQPESSGPRVAAALAACALAQGAPVRVDSARRAAAVARRWSL